MERERAATGWSLPNMWGAIEVARFLGRWMAWGAGATNEHCLSRAPDDKAMDPAARPCLGKESQPRVALRCALLAGRFRVTNDGLPPPAAAAKQPCKSRPTSKMELVASQPMGAGRAHDEKRHAYLGNSP
jgi:hypothetical protein